MIHFTAMRFEVEVFIKYTDTYTHKGTVGPGHSYILFGCNFMPHGIITPQRHEIAYNQKIM